jgi:F0F1-type ATP synthase delta subunit
VEAKASPSSHSKNPYVVNFMKVLVEKKDEQLEPDAMKALIEDMYRLYECMLGQNMIQSLPEEKREEYLALTSDLSKLSYDKIKEYFDSIENYPEIMKATMKQFAEIFMNNATFKPEDYPVPLETCSTD